MFLIDWCMFLIQWCLILIKTWFSYMWSWLNFFFFLQWSWNRCFEWTSRYGAVFFQWSQCCVDAMFQWLVQFLAIFSFHFSILNLCWSIFFLQWCGSLNSNSYGHARFTKSGKTSLAPNFMTVMIVHNNGFDSLLHNFYCKSWIFVHCSPDHRFKPQWHCSSSRF